MPRNLEIEVKLTTPINIGVDGKQKSVDTILLTAPSGKQRKLAGRLKRICASTMVKESQSKEKEVENAKEKVKDEEINIKGIDIVNLLASASMADYDLMDDVFDTFFGLLYAGCGSIEGQEITEYILDKITYEDLELLMGEYVATFLLDSLTRKQGGKK